LTIRHIEILIYEGWSLEIFVATSSELQWK
jgi:hypothetical protein